MNICQCIVDSARRLPNRAAIVYEGRPLSYAELNRRSAVAGNHLKQLGIGPGDRVALILPNVPAFAVWYYGALRVGAIVVSVNTRLAAAEIAYVLEDCGASVALGYGETLASLEREDTTGVAVDVEGTPAVAPPDTNGDMDLDAYVDAQPDDPALILYTSGTTGFAKGATLSHRNVRSNVAAFNHLCDMRPHDTILLAVPLFHCFGQNALLNSALNVGATLVLQNRFDLHEAKRLIVEHQVTQLYGVPMMFQLLHDCCDPTDLATVDYCFSAAATLPVQTSRSWQAKFIMPIHEGYGLTETSPFASYNHRDHYRLGSIGTPIDAVEMRVVHPDSGEPCVPGDLGEIAIRGPNVMLGYWNRAEETAAAIRDGWFHSGDIGRVDEDGFFYIVDRVKDMIAVGGMKIFPAEVERVLLDHADIVEVAVVGVPDAVFGEQVIAFVVLAEDAAPADAVPAISRFAKAQLANYKVPRRILPVERLPRNPSGKILKTELRSMAGEAGSAAAVDAGVEADSSAAAPLWEPSLKQKLASVHPSEQLREATEFVCALVQAVLDDSEPIDAEARLLETGLDSLMIVEMSTQIQAEVGVETPLPATLVFEYPRVMDLAKFLVELLRPSAPETAAATARPPESSHPLGTPDGKRTEMLSDQIQAMSEEEALSELMKELE